MAIKRLYVPPTRVGALVEASWPGWSGRWWATAWPRR